MNKVAIKKKVLAEIDRRADEIIDYANAIWRYPELGFKEFKTAELTEKKYEEMGWKYEKEIAITGSKAYLKNDGSKPSIGIIGSLTHYTSQYTLRLTPPPVTSTRVVITVRWLPCSGRGTG